MWCDSSYPAIDFKFSGVIAPELATLDVLVVLQDH